jgi:hypothetical protein
MRCFVTLVTLMTLACLTCLVSCGGTSEGAPSTAASTARPTGHRTFTVRVDPLPPGVHLSFIQQRIDEGTRRSQVRVVNGDARPVHVVSVGVDWAGFPLRPNRVDYDVPGQQTVDLRYFLPRADCSPAAGAAPMYGVAVTRRTTIRTPMAADGRRFLSRIWRTECAARRLHRAVSVRYGATWTEDGTGQDALLHGSLVLTRGRGAEPVTVDQVDGSVLFELRTPGATALAAGAQRVVVPLDVSTGGRCDPHSRGQSTQTFLFRVFLRLGDGDPVGELVVPTRAQQARLLTYLDHACAGVS